MGLSTCPYPWNLLLAQTPDVMSLHYTALHKHVQRCPVCCHAKMLCKFIINTLWTTGCTKLIRQVLTFIDNNTIYCQIHNKVIIIEINRVSIIHDQFDYMAMRLSFVSTHGSGPWMYSSLIWRDAFFIIHGGLCPVWEWCFRQRVIAFNCLLWGYITSSQRIKRRKTVIFCQARLVKINENIGKMK